MAEDRITDYHVRSDSPGKNKILVTKERSLSFKIEESVLKTTGSSRFGYGLKAEVLRERQWKQRKSNLGQDSMNRDLASLDLG